jgi:proteasome accessory factor C
MTTPQYVTRFARVARAIPILALHPAGMRLSELAAQLGTTEDELREEIRAYYQADVPPGLSGAYREPMIEFGAYGRRR